MRPHTALRRGLLTLVAIVALAVPGAAGIKRVAFPTAFRPDTLNNVAVSPSLPLAFAASRDTDTVFAFDPRSGVRLGEVQVGDGPLFVRIFEASGRRTLAVSCDGVLGGPQNLIAVVDATDPAAMRVTAKALIPTELQFLLGYSAVLFSPDGATLLAALTDTGDGSARGIFMTFDVATGAERGRVEIGFAPSSAAIANLDGKTVVAVSHATAPSGRVTVVDVTNPAVPTVLSRVTLPDGSGMFNVNTVALSPDGHVGYVCSSITNFLFTFDVATGAILSYSYSGAFPTAVLAFTQDGAPRLLVVAENSAAVFVWDVSNSRRPQELAHFYSRVTFIDSPAVVTRDGKTAFATTTDGNSVIAVDLVTGAGSYQDAAGTYPVSTGLWEDQSGVYIAVLGALSDDVTCLQATTRGFRRQGVFSGAPGSVEFSIYQNVVLSRDGRYAFVSSSGTNELLAVNVETGTIAGRLPVGHSPVQIAISEPASGPRRIAVLNSDDSSLALVDASNPSAMSLLGSVDIESPSPVYLSLTNLVFSGDGSTLFVADASQFVSAIDVASAELVGVIGTGFVPVKMAMREADGKRVLAVLNGAGQSTSLALIDATDPRSMKRSTVFQAPQGLIVALNNVPAFSEDGRFVVFGASVSKKLLAVDVQTGALAASVDGVSPVRAATFTDGKLQRFAAFDLGVSQGRFFKLSKSGGVAQTSVIAPLEHSFAVASNVPFISPDGARGDMPDYGRGSLVAFDPKGGRLTGEIPLGAGPSDVAVDWTRNRAVIVDANGSASTLVVTDLADVTTVSTEQPLQAARRGASRGLVIERPQGGGQARVQYFSTSKRRLVAWRRR